MLLKLKFAAISFCALTPSTFHHGAFDLHKVVLDFNGAILSKNFVTDWLKFLIKLSHEDKEQVQIRTRIKIRPGGIS